MVEASSGAKEEYQKWLERQIEAQKRIEQAVREKLGGEVKFKLGRGGVIATEGGLIVGQVTEKGGAFLVSFKEIGTGE